jgi:alpha(1,3/1,4) fucosyltransferase
MNKPLLKLGFIDYCNPIDEFFIDTLSRQFQIERNDENPDYLIFCDKNFGQQNMKFNDRKVIKIFFTGENARPFEYHAHHAISFDHLDGKHFYRLPLYVLDNWVNTKKLKMLDITQIPRTATASEKTGFCSFVVRNGGCNERNNMFFLLSEYKKVDSGGPLFNNTGEILNREGLEGFHVSKKNFLQKRKFNLCYENSSYPGYVTEKIFHALTYNTIPIYWGSPTVEIDFNPKAFVSRHDFRNDKEMLDFIVHLDNNENAYNEMLQQPILNFGNKFLDLDRFNHWFMDSVYRGVING